MFDPDFDAFSARYEAGEPALVSLRLVSDLETPVSAFLKLSQGRKGDLFLLESVEGGAARGRYSMIGLDPDVIFRVQDGKAEINRAALHDRDAFVPCAEKPLDALRALLDELAIPARIRIFRPWRPASSAISAMTWCAQWSGWRRRNPTRSARRTRRSCARP